MPVSQIRQVLTQSLLVMEVLVGDSLEAVVVVASVPFKENCHRLKKYAIMEDRKKE